MSDRILVDAKNTFCPGPLMELISNMKMADVGAELELLSTDIAAKLAAVVCATVAVIDVALTVLSWEASV